MIEFIDKNPKHIHTQSIIMTYPRTVQITFGNYPYPDQIHNFIMEIKQNISEKDSYASNVKAKKTSWYHFVDHPLTTKFINYCVNQHQVSNPNLFQYFYEKKTVINGWGNQVEKGDFVTAHTHKCYHAILYLTEGSPLILPELNIKINPKPGDYYFFPPHILHGVDEHLKEETRYNVVFNIEELKIWDKEKKLFLREKAKK